MNDTPPENNTSYASPPCFMHELGNGAMASSAEHWPDIRRWRKTTRERLIAERLAVPAGRRWVLSQSIAQKLDELIGNPKGNVIGLYWPFRGEPDLRPWLASVSERGAMAALPVVISKAAPLIFRCYRPGEPLKRGVWNIPEPTNGGETIPDIVISPLVGFDPDRYRLGYGGGFYDRTIAVLPKKPLLIGIGYAFSALTTIYPQPHDIPMDHIVTAG